MSKIYPKDFEREKDFYKDTLGYPPQKKWNNGEDVLALWEQLKNKADRIVFPPRHNDWGDTSFAVQDPEGLEITFFTNDKND